MSMIVSARRRQAEDLQALLDGGRASSPAAADALAPLVALATALAPSDVRPGEDFRAALRERLLTEAVARVPAPRAVVTVDGEQRSPRHRVRQAVAAVAVTSVVVGAGAAAASTRALPGDTLYGLKRQVENVQLALAHGDVGHGRELLEQADARLGEAEALASGESSTTPETRARLAGALADMDTAVTAAATDLTRAYRETGDEEPMQLLARFVAEQQDRLDDLLPLLDPQLRAEVRALQARLAELDQQASSLLGLALESSTGAGATAPTGSAGAALDRSGRSGAGGGAPGGAGSAGGVDGTVATSAAGGAAGSAAGAAGAGGAVDDVVDTLTGAGSSGGSGGTSGGTTSGGGVLGGAGTTSTAPLPSAAPLPTVSVHVPVPSSAPVPTAAPLPTVPVPLPTASTLPSVSVCVPVPPLTSC